MTRSLTLAVLLAMVAACGVEDPTGGLPPGDAQLALMNALPPGTVATLLLDDQVITLPTTGARISRVIPEGSHRLEARREGGNILASAHFTVTQGGRRTAFIGGSATGSPVTILVGVDTTSAPAMDQTKVRIVHTVQGIPTLEAWLAPSNAPAGQSSARLLSPFNYGVGLSGEFPGYVVRAPGSYRIRVTQLATGAEQAELVHEFGPGEVWSVVLTRRLDGELELLPIQER